MGLELEQHHCLKKNLSFYSNDYCRFLLGLFYWSNHCRFHGRQLWFSIYMHDLLHVFCWWPLSRYCKFDFWICQMISIFENARRICLFCCLSLVLIFCTVNYLELPCNRNINCINECKHGFCTFL